MRWKNLNFIVTFKITDKQEVVKNHEEVEAIVVADKFNKNNYQYLLDEKKWVKIKEFPESVGEIRGIHEIVKVFYLVGD